MRIVVAGSSIDLEIVSLIRRIIEEFRGADDSKEYLYELLEQLAQETLTAESLAASFALVSRSPRQLNELRRDSRAAIGRARTTIESLQREQFAPVPSDFISFNLQVSGISLYLARFTAESVPVSCSPLELTTGGEPPPFIVPEGGEEFAARFRETVMIGLRICARLKEQNAVGWQKFLPHAVQTDAGIVGSGTGLKRLIEDCSGSDIPEFIRFGNELHKALKAHAPSILGNVSEGGRSDVHHPLLHGRINNNEAPSVRLINSFTINDLNHFLLQLTVSQYLRPLIVQTAETAIAGRCESLANRRYHNLLDSYYSSITLLKDNDLIDDKRDNVLGYLMNDISRVSSVALYTDAGLRRLIKLLDQIRDADEVTELIEAANRILNKEINE